MDRPQFIKPSEAAEVLSISRKTILRLIKDRQLPALRVRGQYRIPLGPFEAMISMPPAQARKVMP
jgi:excisionase family DNA binding protein